MERTGIITMKGNPLTLVGPALKVGDHAPDFEVVDKGMAKKTLKDFDGKFKVISVTPSLDTPVCDLQIRWFNEDLPFALARLCATGGIDKVEALSDHRTASFGTNWGVLIKELRLLARSVFVVDDKNVIRYIQIVPEQTNAPDYDAALEALKAIL